MSVLTSGRRCTVGDLIEARLLHAGDVLNRGRPQKGATHYATVLANGDLRFDDGRQFSSPTAAATLADRHSVPDGWTVWHLPDGRSLAELRDSLAREERDTSREAGPRRRPFEDAGEPKSTGDGLVGDSNPPTPSVAEVEENPRQSPSRRSESSRPESLSVSKDAEWVPAGQSTEIDGRIIGGGLVYVGSGEPSVDGGEIEPCLIDPALPVEWNDPDWLGETMYGLPSYGGLDPRARAAYLSWLAHGRCAEQVYVGFVFLFYYGLERRVLADLKHRPEDSEVEVIVAEIERLRSVYGASGSFKAYASSLLGFLRAVRSASGPGQRVVWNPSHPESADEGVPQLARVALGQCIADGSPIPTKLALSYLRHHPQRPHRTPETRCRDEFDELFQSRYRQRWGDGVTTAVPQQELVLSYRPATSGMRDEVSHPIDWLPDVEAAPSILDRLKDLAWQCIDDLEGYSRFLARRPGDADSAAALALLPEDLLNSRGGPLVDEMRDWAANKLAAQQGAVVAWDEIVDLWSQVGDARLTKNEAVLVAALFAKLNLGLEPDVRFGAPAPQPGSQTVLFKLPEGAPAVPSPRYSAAAAVVHLSAVVAAADGTVSAEERQHLVEHIQKGLQLDAAECVRLEARMDYLSTCAPDTRHGLHRIEALPAEERASVGEFLIDVAAADGEISPEEVRTLMTIFGHLRLGHIELFRLLSTRVADIGDPGPITVIEAHPGRDWEVPQPPDQGLSPSSAPATVSVSQHPAESVGDAPAPGVALDPDAIRRTLAEDTRARVLLESIFADDTDSVEANSFDESALADESLTGEATGLDSSVLDTDALDGDMSDAEAVDVDEPGIDTTSHYEALLADARQGTEAAPATMEDAERPLLPTQTSTIRSSGLLVWGLDNNHTRLAVALTTETRWSRRDIEDLARPIGLGMLNGAIDVINEAVIDSCDEPLLDGYDPLELNVYAAEQLMDAYRAVEDGVTSAFSDDWQSAASHLMGVEMNDATPGAW